MPSRLPYFSLDDFGTLSPLVFSSCIMPWCVSGVIWFVLFGLLGSQHISPDEEVSVIISLSKISVTFFLFSFRNPQLRVSLCRLRQRTQAMFIFCVSLMIFLSVVSVCSNIVLLSSLILPIAPVCLQLRPSVVFFN